jgi:UDP-glucose 4-epimerase
MSSNWLVTGGAGYIGAHVVRDLIANEITPVVIDDLSTGLKRKIPKNIQFFQGSLLDLDFLENVFSNNVFDGVIHLAAKKSVGESVLKPELYFEENVGGLVNLLTQMKKNKVKNMVYSSSAAVYGEPQDPLVSENSSTIPQSPYGETKLIGEWLIKKSNLNAAILRYFNVAGAGSKELADTAADNVIPKVFKALSEGKTPEIFGDDYSTHDGTCIRDYVHVSDLSHAHVLAAKKLETEKYYGVLNVGTGVGVSVKEMFTQIQKSVGENFDYKISPRRYGDPAATVAQVSKIEKDFSFQTKFNLSQMVDSAWQAWQFNLKMNKN